MNGGLFATNVAIKHSHVFAAVCSFMGGFKWQFNMSPVETLRKIPLLFVAGGADQNLGHSLEAYGVFSELGSPRRRVERKKERARALISFLLIIHILFSLSLSSFF